MKAAVIGRPFQIRWGGATDLIYAEDVAQACVAASDSALDGARVYNLHGESAKIADVVRLIEARGPSRPRQALSRRAAHPVSRRARRPGYQRDLGPRPRTCLSDGVREDARRVRRPAEGGPSRRAGARPPRHERDRLRPPPTRMRRRSASSTTRASRTASPRWRPSCVPPRSAAVAGRPRPAHPVFVARRTAQVVGWGSLNVYNPRPAYQLCRRLLDLHRARVAGEGRGPPAARAPHRAGAGARLPQDDALGLPLQRLRGGPLRALASPGRASSTRWASSTAAGWTPYHGEAALGRSLVRMVRWSPQGAQRLDDQVRGGEIGGHRHVVNIAHAQERADVGLMRLRAERIPRRRTRRRPPRWRPAPRSARHRPEGR